MDFTQIISIQQQFINGNNFNSVVIKDVSGVAGVDALGDAYYGLFADGLSNMSQLTSFNF